MTHPALRTAACLCVLALACAAPAAPSVDDYLGKPVASVRLVLDGRETTEPALVQVLETRVGRPLSMIEVRESVNHLFSLGRFDDVRVDASLEASGVALRYDLSPAHVVTRIEFVGSVGAPGVDVGQLRRAVVDRYGPSPPLSRVADLTRVLVDTLQERGYRHSDVQPRATLSRSGQAVLAFTIEPGPRTRVGAVTIVGTPTVSRPDLLRQIGLAPGAPYRPGVLGARIARYIESRRQRGYYEAQVTPAVQFADGDRVVNLTLTVVPGPLVRVVFTGDPLPPEKRDELVPVEREGSADEDLLEDSSNRIEAYLRGQGYRDAKAPHTREEVDGELRITFALRRGPHYRVGRVDFSGNAAIATPELLPLLRTREGEPLSEANLDADVGAIEGLYRARGFTAAKARYDARPEPVSAGVSQIPVTVGLVITEGVRTTVGPVRLVGNASIPEAALREGLRLQPGVSYFEPWLAADRDAIQLQYANLGYRNATVQVDPGLTPDRTEVRPVFTIREGLQTFVDHILIAGNVRTSSETIERELQLKSGDPLSLAAEFESQRRLAALQLFRRAPQITELRHGDETKRDLLITVEEAPATSLGYGGGVEGRLRVVRREEDNGRASERFEVAPRAFLDIGRRNLFGKNRSVNLFASASLHPKDSPFFANQPERQMRGGYGFTEYRVLGTFHEPRLLGTSIDGLLTGTIEQQIRSSFNFARRSATAQISRRLTRGTSVSGAYQLQRTELLDVSVAPADQPLVDRAFTQVRLSSFSASGLFDTRDDPVNPTTGEYVSLNGQLAARRIGSEVGFAKSFFTAEAFRTLPRTSGTVLAARALVGLATGFPRDVVQIGADGRPIVVSGERDLPEPERFFAGGDTTVRGFALDTLGRPDTIKDGFPIGGNALVIFNAELRAPVSGALGVVGFIDTGNVFAHAADIDLGTLRSAVGFGIRARSPIGPIRVDVGVKVNRQPGEGRSAWFITFGQAF